MREAADRIRAGDQPTPTRAMPAAADQGQEAYPSGEYRSTGAPDAMIPPMQEQQWHAVHDKNKDGQPMGDRYTIYADDERVVCQTNGTWSKGPNELERKPVAALIQAAPTMRAALVEAEKYLRGLIQADPGAGQSGMKSPHYGPWSACKIALGDTNPDSI